MAPGEGIRVELVEEERLSGCPRDLSRPARYRAIVNCGKPVLGMELEIRGESGNPVPDHHIGKVWCRGSSVMHSYYRDPDATEHPARQTVRQLRPRPTTVRRLVHCAARTAFAECPGTSHLVVCRRVKHLRVRRVHRHIDHADLPMPGTHEGLAATDEGIELEPLSGALIR